MVIKDTDKKLTDKSKYNFFNLIASLFLIHLEMEL